MFWVFGFRVLGLGFRVPTSISRLSGLLAELMWAKLGQSARCNTMELPQTLVETPSPKGSFPRGSHIHYHYGIRSPKPK